MDNCNPEDREDIVYVDLTQYDGPWPIARDYGLSKTQWERYLDIRKSKPYEYFLWFIPLLAFVVPNRIYSLFPPFAWLMHALGYMFPVLQAARYAYGDVDKAQFVLGMVLLSFALYAPWFIRNYADKIKAKLNACRYSAIMYRVREDDRLPLTSPKSLRQLFLWIGPFVVLIFVYMAGCDIAGYVLIYLFHEPVKSVASIEAPLGGIISGFGWYHGVIYEYVTSDRPSGFASTDFGLLLQAYLILCYLVLGVRMFIMFYVIQTNGGYRKWIHTLKQEEEHLTEMLAKAKAAAKQKS